MIFHRSIRHIFATFTIRENITCIFSQSILEYVFAHIYFRFPREENHESIVSPS